MSILLYDPDCGICTRTANYLGRLDLQITIAPGLQKELLARGVDTARFAHAIPLVLDSGQVAYGVVAIALTLKSSRRRLVRVSGGILLAPGIRKVAESAYALVAENRWRFPGSHCALRRES